MHRKPRLSLKKDKDTTTISLETLKISNLNKCKDAMTEVGVDSLYNLNSCKKSNGTQVTDSLIELLKKSLKREAEFKLKDYFPPVSIGFILLQFVCYFMSSGKKDDFKMTWSSVVRGRDIWKLFVAHFFHFDSMNLIFLNSASLLTLGRYLEKKIKMAAFIALVLVLGAISNFIYILLEAYISRDTNTVTDFSGFARLTFALKMLQIFSKGVKNQKEPTLLLGIFPVFLPHWLAPWEPMTEGVLLDIIFKGKNFSLYASGICAGLTFLIFDYFFHDEIMLKAVNTFECKLSESSSVSEYIRKSTKISLSINSFTLREEKLRRELFQVLPNLA